MSLRLHLFRTIVNVTIKRRPKRLEDSVAHFRRVVRPALPQRLAAGYRVGKTQLAGVDCATLEADNTTRSLIYIHGGGFVAGMPETYFNFCSRLAAQMNARVILPRYRLAPEHPFPAAPDDVFAVYRALLEQGQAADSILIAGDSAGGSLSLSVLVAAKQAGVPQPAACLALSPATDMTIEGGSHARHDRKDPMLSEALIDHFRMAYTPTEASRLDPRASPALADLRDCAPLIITVSRDECLYDHTSNLVAQAQSCGVPFQLLERDGLFHIWPTVVPFLPEAQRDFDWIINQLPATLRS